MFLKWHKVREVVPAGNFYHLQDYRRHCFFLEASGFQQCVPSSIYPGCIPRVEHHQGLDSLLGKMSLHGTAILKNAMRKKYTWGIIHSIPAVFCFLPMYLSENELHGFAGFHCASVNGEVIGEERRVVCFDVIHSLVCASICRLFPTLLAHCLFGGWLIPHNKFVNWFSIDWITHRYKFYKSKDDLQIIY